MTIITGGTLSQDKDNLPTPEVVDDYVFLMENEKNEEKKSQPLELKKGQSYVVDILDVSFKRRRQRSMWLVLLILFVLGGLILSCVCLYQKMLHEKQTQQFFCGVKYHELLAESLASEMGPQSVLRSGNPLLLTDRGEFEQSVEIEDYFEKIVVPTIGDTKRATILHDFNVNYTAIIDKDQGHCFLLPLNRSLVLPPRDFWDLLIKLKSGYYVPDASLVREDYRVLTPSILDFAEFGVYIAGECHYFDTYRLVREGQPFAMAKRSACEFEGDSYCLGDAGVNRMLCLNIKGCI